MADSRSIFVEERSHVYTQNSMRPKLVIAIVVLALSGANSCVASMCAAYCMSSAFVGSAAVHHQMVSQPSPTSISHHIHAHHNGAECADCPPKSGNRMNQKADCASLVQIQALKEGSFSLDAPNKVAQIDAAATPAEALSLASDRERSLVFDTSPTIRSSNPASVPLRI